MTCDSTGGSAEHSLSAMSEQPLQHALLGKAVLSSEAAQELPATPTARRARPRASGHLPCLAQPCPAVTSWALARRLGCWWSSVATKYVYHPAVALLKPQLYFFNSAFPQSIHVFLCLLLISLCLCEIVEYTVACRLGSSCR